MRNTTLLGHLALSISEQPENLATSALAFILQRSDHARQALGRLLNQGGVKISGNVAYRAQAASVDGSIPDLVGTDETGREVVVIESKFWAGLTDNQPCSYIDRLAKGCPAMLLFIAPALRAEPLWIELIQRCNGRAEGDTEMPVPGARFISLGNKHRLGMVTWKTLLALMAADAETAGELATASDLRQLEGLCDHMDSEAFTPMRSEEFAPAIPRRLRQLGQLIEDVSTKAVDAGFAQKKTTKGTLRSGSSMSYYGRYLFFGKVGIWLGVRFTWWTQLCETPVWLEVCGCKRRSKTVALGGRKP